MNAEKARMLAAVYNGELYPVGEEYLVLVRRADDHLIVFSETQVTHYRNKESFHHGDPPSDCVDLI